jgi:UPF0176 protein
VGLRVNIFKHFQKAQKAQNRRSIIIIMHHHSAVVLFYRYFTEQEFDVEQLQSFCHDICAEYGLKGRLLLATEGINGTVSAIDRTQLQQFIAAMEQYEQPVGSGQRPFDPIDWKISFTTAQQQIATATGEGVDAPSNDIEPFPDLKIRIVSEIISTGGSVSVHDIPTHGGTHLSPQEFHEALTQQQHGTTNDDVVLIDVRNTFEHDIGHFIHPATQTPAWNPATVTFSSFETTFCARHVQELQHKKVLLYCTGGIRCEKAAVMLKRLGVPDVSQLHGGIHRYLETYGNTGYFRGKNFVFDQRVAQTPAEVSCIQQRKDNSAGNSSNDDNDDSNTALSSPRHYYEASTTPTATIVVGRCLECHIAFDELCGARICTVCRDLVLVCPQCEHFLREYHCRHHAMWKQCYYTFLEPYSKTQLQHQLIQLERFRTELPSNRGSTRSRNVRRTLTKQIEKVTSHLLELEKGIVAPHPDAPKRCRTCMEPRTKCNGRCWGFWKQHNIVESSSSSGGSVVATEEETKPIKVGDIVEPGPDWNDIRYGRKYAGDGRLRRGRVVQMKTWSAGSTAPDCAVVLWDGEQVGYQEQIYRWGVPALDGQRIYELVVVVVVVDVVGDVDVAVPC